MTNYAPIFETSLNKHNTASFLLQNVSNYKALIGISQYFTDDLAFSFALQALKNITDKYSHRNEIQKEFKQLLHHIGTVLAGFTGQKLASSLSSVTKYSKGSGGKNLFVFRK